MPPFRFIHAADLFLDHQLRQIDYTDRQLTAIAEESTLSALRQIVETAIEEEVDFLLLAGNSFDQTDHSLLAETTLIDCLQRLDEQGIDVYILPGAADPLHAWEALTLPKNTTLLTAGTAPISVEFDQQTIATLYAACPKSIEHSTPFPIVLTQDEAVFPPVARQFEEERIDGPATEYELISGTVDQTSEDLSEINQQRTRDKVRYWALTSGSARRTVFLDSAVAHHPGGTQAISPDQTGPQGCTLVEVDNGGDIELTFIPTAALRYERIEVRGDAHHNQDDLLEALSAAVIALPRHATDQCWLLSWQVSGSGLAQRWLADPEFHLELDEYLQAEFEHAEIYVRSAGPIEGHSKTHQSGPFPAGTLAADFWRELTEPSVVTEESSAPETPEDPAILHGPWKIQLREIKSSLKEQDLLDQAAQWGGIWFADAMEESA